MSNHTLHEINEVTVCVIWTVILVHGDVRLAWWPILGLGLCWTTGVSGKSSESVQCAITGPCLRMRHRPSA